MTKLLSTSALPELPADPEALAEAAEAYRTKASSIVDAGEAVRSTWVPLADVYRAPEAEAALSRMDKVRDTAADLGDAASAIATALDDFATALQNCKTSLATLRDDITTARDAEARQRREWSDEHGSEDGYEIDDRILQQDSYSRDLLAQIKNTIEQAEEDCVTALKRVTGGTGDDLPQPYGPPSPGTPATPDWSTAADTFGTQVTTAALDALADLHAVDPEAAEEYAREHETDFQALIRTPPSVEEANQWWTALAPAASTALTALVPLVVGNMGGVPYVARDTALRGYVSSYTPSGKDTAWDKTISNVKKQLERKGHTAPLQLITLDPTDTDQPRAAISVGLLDESDNVTYLVPGMNTTPDGDEAVPMWMDSALALQAEQLRLAQGSSPAVVAWIGYDTPNQGALPWDEPQFVGADTAAETGGELLADEIRATNTVVGGDPRVNIVAHSYGTTVTSEALQQVGVDSVAMLGSAGLTVDSVDALRVPDDEVYAAESPGQTVTMTPSNRTSYGTYPGATEYDPWAPIGRWLSGRTNPDEAFGATRFSVAGTDTLEASHGHDSNPGTVNPDGSFTSEGDGYLSAKTESLYNVALITTGRGNEVTLE
jgi:hypothetical protein